MALTEKINGYSKNTFVRRVGLVSVSKIILTLSSIVLLPILTKTLPVSEYAIWVLFLVIIGLLMPIADIGLTTAMLRFFPTETTKELTDKFQTIFLFILTSSVLISALLILTSQQTANYLFDGRAEIIKYIAFLFPVIVLNNVCMSYFRARQQIKRLTAFTIIQSVAVTGMVCIAVLSSPNLMQAIGAYGIGQIILFWIMYGLIIKEIGFGSVDFKRLKEYLSFGYPALPQAIAGWMITGSDKFIIGMFLGITYVGYYAPAYGLGSAVLLFMAPLGTLLPSALSELQDTGREVEMWARVRQSIIIFFILSCLSGLVISLFAKNILELLTTPEIAENSYTIVPMIVVASIVYGCQAILSNVLIVKKRIGVMAKITIISAVIGLGANFIFIKQLGIFGASLSLYIMYVVMGLLTMYSVFKLNWKKDGTQCESN